MAEVAPAPESFTAGPNAGPGNAAPFGGRRRSHKKLRLVKKKTVRRMLKKMGLKMRGGASAPDMVTTPAGADAMKEVAKEPSAPATAGRRHRKSKGRSHKRKSLFGLRY
jgi:hypothetical protein